MSKHTPPYQDTPASAAYMRRRDRCQMAFESGDGREIPTEAITVGLVWSLMHTVKCLAEALNSTRLIMQDKADRDLTGEIVEDARALLAKLEPQK